MGYWAVPGPNKMCPSRPNKKRALIVPCLKTSIQPGFHRAVPCYRAMPKNSPVYFFYHRIDTVKSESFLSWKQRLSIAVDAAQALEYLHNGCKPPIIHRDVKTSNILLTTNLQAKVADFGLSRLMTLENESHISTTVVGTLGYLDPEYCLTNKLNSKSDVYSFGVVLLELITGKPAVLRGHGDIESLVQWVNPMLQRGEIRTIFDSRMEDDFDISSAWKALEIATACVFPSFIQRPNMSQVLVELKECLELETLTHQKNSSSTVVEEDLYHLDLYQPPPGYYSATAAGAGLEGFMGPLAR